MSSSHPPLRTFGRIKSRTLKPRQASLMDELLPAISPPGHDFDPRALIPGVSSAWLEVGFGAGEHLAGQAALHPGVLMLGAEPFLNGVGAALARVDDLALTNVRIHAGDARELMARLPDACLERVVVLFPDPWPKTRHHKRRLVEADFIAEAARLLRPGGSFRFATDWADYAHWALQRFLASPSFRWTARRADDWRRPPVDHLTTRYETKQLGDCSPIWLEFERI